MRKLKDVKDAQNSTRLKAHILPFNSPQHGKTRSENSSTIILVISHFVGLWRSQMGFWRLCVINRSGTYTLFSDFKKIITTRNNPSHRIKNQNNFNGKPSRGWRAVGERQKHG